MTEFIQLQNYSFYGSGPRPHSVDERFTLKTKDYQFLHYYFNDEATLEFVNDYFLSEIFFAIREHTHIYSCAMEEDKRTDALLKTMSKCSIKIRDALKVVLTELKMDHVAECMSWWEKDSTPTECKCMYNYLLCFLCFILDMTNIAFFKLLVASCLQASAMSIVTPLVKLGTHRRITLPFTILLLYCF